MIGAVTPLRSYRPSSSLRRFRSGQASHVSFLSSENHLITITKLTNLLLLHVRFWEQGLRMVEHASILCGHCKRSMAFSSFENDMTPVFNRIRHAREMLVLAEWCADHHVDNGNEKLKCLDLGAWISLSIRVSTEVEQQRRLYSRSYDNRIDNLENSLGTVKRITSIKEALKDRL